MKKNLLLLMLIIGSQTITFGQSKEEKPLQVAIIGLTHTHVHWILGREDLGDIEIVGIVEPNTDLAGRYMTQYSMPMEMIYRDMEALMEAQSPEAVFAFGSIFDHLSVVEFFAPRGIHVMVEKPLAVSMAHARRIVELAEKHQIQVFTNYETTWYPTNHKAKELLDNEQLGTLRKVVVHDGHQGPVEIGVNQEFLDWLTDPILNGGGAVTDFGCYGANLLTWLVDGKKPSTVWAMTQTNKPDIYPKVDDEATIVLGYDGMQGVIQASWNWTFSRKDMEVYGTEGYVIADNRNDLRTRLQENLPASKETLAELVYPYNDPFALFAAQIKGDVTPVPYELSSLENNMIVVEILDAAKESAASGTAVTLDPE
ncbi:Gfo/Idh/MocA family protein [Aureitalea marina]|uniref:Oxidoreductase n=1 Tax=Aureitalea marina TaxID=930804 RepID=A0A2S7KPK0_9FLAO|nr:Gfo/Idh/MocA family oxidoreductase [Aureitalea marina]PQB04556.1 oxidoreductase [Aureitalea marina]